MQRKILVLVVALSIAFGAAAVAATDHASIDVEQEPNEQAMVTVVDSGGQAVGNASLTVEVAGGDQPSYDGTGNYTTDVNGTVELPAPDETVDVVVTATVDNETVTTEATLEYHPDLDLSVEGATGQPATVTLTADNETVENATIDVETVEENATYQGTGEYTTDTNGTIELPVPNETVDVTVSTEHRGASALTTTTLEAPPELDVNVEQDRGRPATVTVMADNESATNATVAVKTVDGNVSYAGTGNYTTDANGTVELPAPNETVTITVTAEYNGARAATEARLQAPPVLNVSVAQEGPGLPATVTVLADDEPAENATVGVETADGNVSYAGTGTYETDANGTVELPATETTVEVTVTASYLGAEETVDVAIKGIDAIDEKLPFGQQLQQFKATLDDDNRTGREIASWVTENNPGNAPDHAGPKDNPGESTAESGKGGPPAHAGGNRGESDVTGSDDAESDDGNDKAGGGNHGKGNAGGASNGNSGGNGPPGNRGDR